MRNRGRLLATGAALLASLWLAGAANALPAGDYNLGTVNSHTEFTAGNGLLEFSNFQFYFGGADKSAFTLSILDDGIRLTGPTSVMDGADKEYYFTYEVSVLPGVPGIIGTALFAPSEIVGEDCPPYVKTGKNVYAGPTPEFFGHALVSLETYNYSGLYSELDTATFAPQSQITVLDGIQLATDGPGEMATLISISNTFTVIPEPATFGLLGFGLLGLGVVGRRR
jgi:hypothetical protein